MKFWGKRLRTKLVYILYKKYCYIRKIYDLLENQFWKNNYKNCCTIFSVKNYLLTCLHQIKWDEDRVRRQYDKDKSSFHFI